MTPIDPTDYDQIAELIGRRAEVIIAFGPHTHFADVIISDILRYAGGVAFRDSDGNTLVAMSTDIEALRLYPVT